MEKPKTDQMIKSLIGPLAIWAITMLLERPAVKGALEEVDSHAFLQQRKALRRARRAGKNLLSNPAWLAAGAAAVAVGIGLMAKGAAGNRRK